MADYAISAKDIAKRYTLGERSGLLKRAANKRSKPEDVSEFWALDGVSFDIASGEAVGIIGHNGAGKSTLLKVLSRITEPTRGRASIAGRVASLLEVGTGFHPELTGRENIFMNGSILGMKRAEISRAFDEIVAFAGVEKFVDTPVKRYSSGMYVRLAFSVAAHLEPEILIVDEVLAVGDIHFQKKCLGKMGDVSRSGRTVVFVSHNMAAVRQLTTRCLLLKSGRVYFDGLPEPAIDLYSQAAGAAFEAGSDLSAWPRPAMDLSRSVEFRSLGFMGGTSMFELGDALDVEIYARSVEAHAQVRVSGTVFQADGSPVGSFFSRNEVAFRDGEVKRIVVRLPELRLAPGSYQFGLALVKGNESSGHREFDVVLDVLPFEIGAIPGADGTLGAWHKTWGPIRMPSPMLEADHG